MKKTEEGGRTEAFRIELSAPHPSGILSEEAENVIELKVRTKQFALRIIRLSASLPGTLAGRMIGTQILRSGTSVGAQYREGCRARSNAEFISKLEASLQELEETAYWLELLLEGEVVPKERLTDLCKETDELIAILVTCVKKAKGG
jgi:four helix bundle protein